MKKKSSYRSGYLVELKARDELRKMGAKIVVRSSRSLTPVDLIAIFPDKRQIWLVQCKSKREFPEDEKRLLDEFSELVELGGNYEVIPVLYMKKGRKYDFKVIRGNESG